MVVVVCPPHLMGLAVLGEGCRDGVQVPRNMTLPAREPAPCQLPGGAWHGKRAVVSTDRGSEAGGLDGLGGKPEGMTRRHKATPTCWSLRK